MSDIIRTLNDDEWERLCDCCGICCLYKFEDIDTDEVFYTEVMCPLMDIRTAHCTSYADRFEKVSTCRKISPESLPEIHKWLPRHCAYRCLYEGRRLPEWHPLYDDATPEGAALREKLEKTDLSDWKETVNRALLKEILMQSVPANLERSLKRQMIRNVIEEPLA